MAIDLNPTPTSPISCLPKPLGSALKQGRVAANLTLKQVGGHTGLAISTLSDIENDKRPVSATELFRLSKLYGRPITFFFDEEATSAPFTVLLRAATDAEIDRGLIIKFHEMCRDYRSLEKLAGAPSPSCPPDYSNTRPSTLDDAERLAQSERSSLGLDGQPIRDICDLLERKRGVRIFHLPGDTATFSGAFACDDRLGACFLINSNHPSRRRVFTIAHEYAHCMAHRDQLAHIDSDSSGDVRDKRERLANAFAAAFLMPRHSVIEMWMQQRTAAGKGEPSFAPLMYLATYFGVSFEAIGWRLVSLRLLSGNSWDELRTHRVASSTFARLLGYDNDQDKPEVLPRYYKVLAFEAYQAGMISVGRLAELLRVNYHELRQNLDLGRDKGNV